MLRNLLTPLKTAFGDTKSPAHSRQASATILVEDNRPEDFAHDVRVELLRRAIDELRYASDVAVEMEVCQGY